MDAIGRGNAQDRLLACCRLETDGQGHIVEYEIRARADFPLERTTWSDGYPEENLISATTQTTPPPRTVPVEFLYLDLDTCDRCQGADANLDAAIALLAPVLTEAGVALHVEKRLVGSLEEAQALHFVSSPTVRVGGHDIVLDVQENACGACSEIAGTPVACRAWTWRGEEHPVPPTGMLVEALLRALYGGDRPAAVRPEAASEANLAAFFAGKARAATGACASGSCGCGD